MPDAVVVPSLLNVQPRGSEDGPAWIEAGPLAGHTDRIDLTDWKQRRHFAPLAALERRGVASTTRDLSGAPKVAARVALARLAVVTDVDWIAHGVKIFRVDNPHTKPPDFWAWLIAVVKATDPDVLFLSEAFTRPARLYGLAKLGFTQSYSYFTWRTAKWELEEFGRQIAEHADYARPNLFVNTPDILHASLQDGGPSMFAIRAVLASTMGASWGVYSGFELFENAAVHPGSEEYLDSEKYELRPRDFDRALQEGRSLEIFLSRLNEIRRVHPALCQLRTIRFHGVDNDALMAMSKFDPVTGDTVLVVVTLNPFVAEEGFVWLDMESLGMHPYERFWVRDEITGEEYQWGQSNYVRLEPAKAVAHILTMPAIPEGQRALLLRRE